MLGGMANVMDIPDSKVCLQARQHNRILVFGGLCFSAGAARFDAHLAMQSRQSRRTAPMLPFR